MSATICDATPVSTNGGTLIFDCSTTPQFLWAAQTIQILDNTYNRTFSYNVNENQFFLAIRIGCARPGHIAPDFVVTYTLYKTGNPPPPPTVVAGTALGMVVQSSLSSDGATISVVWFPSGDSSTRYDFTIFTGVNGILFGEVEGMLTQKAQITGDEMFMEPLPNPDPTKVEVPTINIFAQFNIQGTNLAEAMFTIQDTKRYCCNPDPGQCEKRPILISPNKVKTTQLFRSPCMNLVVEGKVVLS